MYLKSAIEGVVIKWATQINDVLTQESSQAFDGGQNPTPNAGKLLKNFYYVFFWVFPRRLIVVCRRFGTLYRFHLQGLDVKYEK